MSKNRKLASIFNTDIIHDWTITALFSEQFLANITLAH